MIRNGLVKQLILFNLLAAALFLFLSLPPLDYKKSIQAIDMEMNHYAKDFYIESYVAKVDGRTGSVKYKFNGPSGVYNIHVEYVDETDGESDYNLKINNVSRAKWTEDINPTKDRSFIYTSERLALLTNDYIEIEGTRNRYSSARLVGISIESVEGPSLAAYLKYAASQVFPAVFKEGIKLTVIYLLFLTSLNLIAIFVHLRRTRVISVCSIENTHEFESSEQEITVMASQPAKQSVPMSSLEANGDDQTLLEEMFGFIEANYADSNFSLQQMSDHFNLSPTYLSMYFKKHTGLNITFYLTNLRLEKAKYYWAHTNLPLQSVANQSGYYNISSFIRRFKSEIGVTPGEYRKQFKSSQDVM